MKKEEKSGQIFDVQILKRIYDFLMPYRLRFWSLVTLIMVSACVVPLNPLLIRYTIDNYIAQGNYPKLALMLLIMIGVLVLQGFLQFVSAFTAGWLITLLLSANPIAIRKGFKFEYFMIYSVKMVLFPVALNIRLPWAAVCLADFLLF